MSQNAASPGHFREKPPGRRKATAPEGWEGLEHHPGLFGGACSLENRLLHKGQGVLRPPPPLVGLTCGVASGEGGTSGWEQTQAPTAHLLPKWLRGRVPTETAL